MTEQYEEVTDYRKIGIIAGLIGMGVLSFFLISSGLVTTDSLQLKDYTEITEEELASPLQKRFGRFTTEPNRTKLYNPGFEKEMEQTIDHSKRYTLIGLGIVSLVVTLSFVIYLLATDTSNTPEREAYTKLRVTTKETMP